VLEGLTTAIIVDQERMGANSRSTVGTVTDANAMLRVLFSRIGEPHVGPPTAYSFNVPTRKAIDKILREHHIDVNKVAEFDNIETIKRAVEVGFGIAIVPLPAVMAAAAADQLAIVKLAEKEWERPVGVIFRSDRTLSLAAKKFVQLLEAPVTSKAASA